MPGLLPKCPNSHGVWGAIWVSHVGGRAPNTWANFHRLLRCICGSCIRCGTARTGTGAHMCCLHCRQQLNQPCLPQVVCVSAAWSFAGFLLLPWRNMEAVRLRCFLPAWPSLHWLDGCGGSTVSSCPAISWRKRLCRFF